MNTTSNNHSNVISLEERGTLLVSPKIKRQIDYLHKRVGKVEWCGVLFYKVVSGKVQSPETLVVRVEGIYPLSIDKETYTEHEFTEKALDMYDLYPEADLAQTDKKSALRYGLIHTHHDMSAFFSGTDVSEHRGNAPHYDWYLSFIVNFSGNYVARVAFTEEVEVKYKYKSYLNNLVDFGKLGSHKRSLLFEFDLDIEFDEEPEEDFKKVVNTLIKEWKDSKTVKKTPVVHHTASPFRGGDSYRRSFPKKKEERTEVKKVNTTKPTKHTTAEGKTVKAPVNFTTIRDFMTGFLLLNDAESFPGTPSLVMDIFKLRESWDTYDNYIMGSFEEEAIDYFGTHIDNAADLTDLLESIIEIFEGDSVKHLSKECEPIIKLLNRILDEDINPLIEDSPEVVVDEDMSEEEREMYLGWGV